MVFLMGTSDGISKNIALSRHVWAWLGAAFSLTCLWWAFRKIHMTELGEYLRCAQLLWLLPAFLAQFIAVIARARRWGILLDAGVSLRTSFWAQGIGYLFTNLFPLRLGEPARILACSLSAALPLPRVAASVVVERLFDVIACVAIVGAVAPFMDIPPPIQHVALILGGLGLFGLVALWITTRLYLHLAGRTRTLPSALSTRFPRLYAIVKDLMLGVLPLNRAGVFLRTTAWTLIAWNFSVLTFWLTIRAFVSDGTWVEACFLTGALSFAVSVPSSPGFIGIFQLAGQQALVQPFDGHYTGASALAITLAAHLVYFSLTTLLGLTGLFALRLSHTDLLQKLYGERINKKLPPPKASS